MPSKRPQAVAAGIDGGGSKTECLLATCDGTCVGYGRGGPINLSFVDADEAQRSLTDALAGALCGEPMHVHAVCVGATAPAEFVQPMIDRWTDYDELMNAGEPPVCLASATVNEWGAVVLAGTGAFAWARNAAGETHRADGWGALLGDEGSAYDIVRRALVAAARAVDGRGPSTILVERFCEHFGTQDFRGVGTAIYRGRLPRHAIAALAPIVSEAASVDHVAHSILSEAGAALAHSLITCLRRVNLTDKHFDVALCGSVFHAGNPIVQPIRDVLSVAAPQATIVCPVGPPVVGALALALRAAGVVVDATLLEKLGNEYRRVAGKQGEPR